MPEADEPPSSSGAINLRRLTRAILVARPCTPARRWRKAKLLVVASQPLQQLHNEVHMARAAREQARAVTNVQNQKELQAMPFWMQGDASLQTHEVLKERTKLRRHPDVVEQLQLWWETAQRSMRDVHGPGYQAAAVTRDEYIGVSRRLSKARIDAHKPRADILGDPLVDHVTPAAIRLPASNPDLALHPRRQLQPESQQPIPAKPGSVSSEMGTASS